MLTYMMDTYMYQNTTSYFIYMCVIFMYVLKLNLKRIAGI